MVTVDSVHVDNLLNILSLAQMNRLLFIKSGFHDLTNQFLVNGS